jgi:hypothetical protein
MNSKEEYFECIQGVLHYCASTSSPVAPDEYRKLCLMVMEEANALYLLSLSDKNFKPLLVKYT